MDIHTELFGSSTVTGNWVIGIGGNTSGDIVGGSQVNYANSTNDYRATVNAGDIARYH